jgi:hypothetical protein
LNANAAVAEKILFTPRDAIRTPARGGFGRGSTIQYPFPGAAIDYYLASAPSGDITLDVLDAAGNVVRKFTSVAATADDRSAGADASAGDDDEGGFRPRSGPTRLDKASGMHRFTWDLRYAGPWTSKTRPEGPNGPMAAPGKYAIRLTAGSWTATQPLTVVEDPRVTKDGVTEADLREQFDHNMRVRELVSDVNKTVDRLRDAQAKLRDSAGGTGDKLAKLNDLASHLMTPRIRYSKPELQTQITYLYSITNSTDQKVGRDAIERYEVLRKELDARIAELNALIE